jgi:O-succinylbenzoic acid--CoA ligase
MIADPTRVDWLGWWARLSPNRLALIAGGDRYTFAELDQLVNRTARQLAGVGVRKDCRVALLLPNSALYAVLVYALARVGGILVLLNMRLAARELAWQLSDSRARVLIYDGALASAVADASGTASELRRLDPDTLAALPQTDTPLHYQRDLADVQGIIYTSTTTGTPKGAELTYGNHWWNAIGSALNLGTRWSDCWLALLPFYHVGGLAILWRAAIFGMPVIVHESFDPDAANRELDRGEVTMCSVVSPMLTRMLEAREGRPYPPSLRYMLLGGGPIPRPLLETCVRQGIPVAPTYGLTETASQVATLPPQDVPERIGSVGHALFPVEIRIEAEARTMATGEVGEILVSGPTVMRGYADRPQETAEVLRDGWMHTGDLGYLDEDGFLYIVDRRDDLIVSGGENIYPAEVEAVLLEHPAIADAAVVGVPDAVWGQIVTAAVRLRSGRRLLEEELRMFCAARLAGYKVPRRVRFVEAIPRSAPGKVQRHLVRDQVIR